MNICEYGCNQLAKYQFKNGKWCCSKNYSSCPARRKDRFTINANTIKRNCRFCGFETNATNIIRHENHCYLNPRNTKFCPVCSKPIKNWKENITCSCSCANTYFRSGDNNPNWKGNEYNYAYNGESCDHFSNYYQKVCFTHHAKKCLICGENLIVAAHHMDGNKDNNCPTNLLPLCPTHHQYWHSRYKYLIENKVLSYLTEFIKNIGGAGIEPAC